MTKIIIDIGGQDEEAIPPTVGLEPMDIRLRA